MREVILNAYPPSMAQQSVGVSLLRSFHEDERKFSEENQSTELSLDDALYSIYFRNVPFDE